MNLTEISNLRLINQHIADRDVTHVKDLVKWMGALQAQDYNMSKWAVGVRLPATTDSMVEEALNKADIIRTHVLRPTWHLVSSEDIYWMLELTAPHIKSSMKGRHRELELTDSILKKCRRVIEKALEKNMYLTRDELVGNLEKAKIATHDQRSSHILFMGELDKVICSGPVIGKKNTYALLEERVPRSKTLNREEGIAELTKRYFTSHGPATLHDFIWWSGLPSADARKGIEMVKSELVSQPVNGSIYWVSEKNFMRGASPAKPEKSVYLLPAFDEFIISYTDRSASLPLNHYTKMISNNGIFRPIVVVDGKVTGLWKRVANKKRVGIEVNFFKAPQKKIKSLLEAEAVKFGKFLNAETELVIKTL